MSQQIGHIEFDTMGHESPQHTVGALFESPDGKTYRYVKFDDGAAVAAVAKNVCYIKAIDLANGVYTISSDYADAGSLRNFVDGVFLSALTDGYYGFVQTYGECKGVTTDGGGDIVKGDFAIAAAANGQVDRMIAGTAPTYKVVGLALADDGLATVDLFLLLAQ
uniref:Tail protein n=1 Tax=viral metagenome TaxID=1070528 RepID=A0A6H1ZK06_9ZZZZ